MPTLSFRRWWWLCLLLFYCNCLTVTGITQETGNTACLLLCLKGLNQNLLPGWACRYWCSVGGRLPSTAVVVAAPLQKGMEGRWFGLQIPCGCWHPAAALSCEAYGMHLGSCKTCCRLIVPHWPPLGSSPKGIQWAPHSSVLALVDLFWGGWRSRCSVQGVCVPPAVFWMPQCFLLLVLTFFRSAEGTELPWESFISNYNAFRVFWWLQGSMFFAHCVRHLALVNGFNLLATAKVTKEANWTKGSFVVRAWSDLTDITCIAISFLRMNF